MKVLDIFSWLSAKEISLEQLEKIFVEYHNGIYDEGKSIGYILKDGNIIAVIGYKE
jgi:hypothetical protein